MSLRIPAEGVAPFSRKAHHNTEIVMKRIALILSTAIALSGLASRALAFPQQPVTDWIRDLYTAEATRIAQSQTLDEAEFLALFTPEVAKLRGGAHRSVDSNAPEEPKLNAFYGWRVAPGAKVSFVAVSKVLGTFDAPTLLVDVVVSGIPRRIVVDAVEDEASWRIANITYDEGEDFVSFEKELARR
jgi:hypothetical protein